MILCLLLYNYSSLDGSLLGKPWGGLSTDGSPSRRLLKNDFMSALASSASTPVVTSRPVQWRYGQRVDAAGSERRVKGAGWWRGRGSLW